MSTPSQYNRGERKHFNFEGHKLIVTLTDIVTNPDGTTTIHLLLDDERGANNKRGNAAMSEARIGALTDQAIDVIGRNPDCAYECNIISVSFLA